MSGSIPSMARLARTSGRTWLALSAVILLILASGVVASRDAAFDVVDDERTCDPLSGTCESIVPVVPTPSERIYWTVDDAGWKVRSTRSGRIEDLPVPSDPRYAGLFVDDNEDRVYWSSYNGVGTWRIHLTDLDGLNARVLFESQLPIEAIDVDLQRSVIYWVSQGGQQIRRVSLDGGLDELVASPGCLGGLDVALDPDAGRLYWLGRDCSPLGMGLWSFDVEQGTAEWNLADENGKSIVVDPRGARVYWSDETTGEVRSVRTDGTDVRVELRQARVLDLDVDPSTGTLYWAGEDGGLYRAGADGTGSQLVVVSPPVGSINVRSAAGSVEVCDNFADDDGDLLVDCDDPDCDGDPACCVDADLDGAADVACGGTDCDDADPNNFPGNAEVCDGQDNDCNTLDDYGTPGVGGAEDDDDADTVIDCADNCPTTSNADQANGDAGYEFQSTVSHVFNQGGGLPPGIAVNDTVTFSLSIPNDQATITSANGFCDPGAIRCYVTAWSIPASQYTLTYSSGHTQVGFIDHVEITDGGYQDFGGFLNQEADRIEFADGFNNVYEVADFDGTWRAGPAASDLQIALSSIDQPALFDLTFYLGDWGNWGTYHYDYTKPQTHTIVPSLEYGDACDNCPANYNPAQTDTDADTFGDACDCAESNPTIFPGAQELCDGLDNDCDTLVDDDDLHVIDQSTWHRDADGDGHGDAAWATEACSQPPGYVANSNDCDDQDGSNYPGNQETCDGQDNDCNTLDDYGTPGVGGAEDDDDADTVIDCADNCPTTPNADQANGDVVYEFQSTVSHVFNQGGGLPPGIAVNDTVTFSLSIPNDQATITSANGFCDPGAIRCYVTAWSIPASQYTLTYSSGHTQVGFIDHVEITDGGYQDFGGFLNQEADKIEFADGFNNVYEVADFDGTWRAGPAASDLQIALSSIDQPALFDLTFYLGDWGNWGTYHYDYTKPQTHTIVPSLEYGDACDNCPANYNPAQIDTDADTIGDACDVCVNDAGNDGDGDGECTSDGDCDDSDNTTNTSATEVCNNADNDCDTIIDNGLGVDADADGHGDPASCVTDATLPIPYDDCDDTDPNNYPGNTEVCDGQDNDCNTVDDYGTPGVGGAEDDDDADTVIDCADNCPTTSNPDQANGDLVYEFQSTVSHVYNQGGGLPPGIAVDDTVTFSLSIPIDQATITAPNGMCFPDHIRCYVTAWSIPASQYTLTYSSGHTQVGFIDHIEITDGGYWDIGGSLDPQEDTIEFADGFNNVYEVREFGGTWRAGPPASDLQFALSSIDQPALFDRTFYWGNWGNWGTYHYDYLKPQTHTIVSSLEYGDACDNCPADYNPSQIDTDADSLGDACDVCVNDAGNDNDGDGSCTSDGDCDDADANSYPGNAEVCDGVDNDCNAQIDEIDADGDGVTCATDCDDGDANNFPGNFETCDGQDNDCNGLDDAGNPGVDGEETDNDGDGQPECGGDCDDADVLNFSGNTEVCDGQDNDCNTFDDYGTPGVGGAEDDDDADTVIDCADNCPTTSNADQANGDLVYEFQSTVSHVYNQGGGLPPGIAVDDTVTFSLSIPTDQATITAPNGMCFPDHIRCYVTAWSIPASQYTLTYSSGHTQVGFIDHIEITDGGYWDIGGSLDPQEDTIEFADGFNNVYEVREFGGTWRAGPPASDLQFALSSIDQPALFDRTFYWGNWGNWGTYHYDYLKPQTHTIVPSLEYGDACDNCPSTPNPEQEDLDENGTGDACDDIDGDGLFDSNDNCPLVPNPGQEDADQDGAGDLCDTWRYDFAPATSQVPEGWEHDDGSVFDVARDHGWDADMDTRERQGEVDPEFATFVFSDNVRTWRRPVPNGSYSVRVVAGDTDYPQGPHRVRVNGTTLIDDQTTTAGEFVDVTLEIPVRNGMLEVTIGGASGATMLNLLEASQLPESPVVAAFSFQPALGSTPAGYVADTGLPYDPLVGYGWDRTVVTRERGKNVPRVLDTLVTRNTAATWDLDLVAGVYEVRVTTGDAKWDQGPHAVTVEGVPAVSGVSTVAGQFYEGTSTVHVSDGRLTVEVGDGLATTTVNQIVVSAAPGDVDGDGVLNDSDNCPLVSNVTQTDTDGDTAGDLCDDDDDNDGVADGSDNCPLSANVDQLDTDGDAAGDACDGDDDNDGVDDGLDNCPLDANPDQADRDDDLVGNLCDPLRIDFAPTASAVPQGWLHADEAYFDSTLGYGWVDFVRTRERASNVAQERKTLVASDASARWRIELPNAEYSIKVVVGDARYPQGTHRVRANGFTILDQTTTTAGEFVEVTGTTQVTTGTLELEIGGAGGTTTLAYVELTEIGTPATLVAVNFETAASGTPDGFVADTGLVYDAGRGYGWSTPLPKRDRGKSVPQTLDTFVFSASTATWELDLPSGTYDVYFAVGDAAWGQGPQRVIVEGVEILNGTVTSAGEFVEQTVTTTVSDGKLTVEVGGGGGVTALNYIVVGDAGILPSTTAPSRAVRFPVDDGDPNSNDPNDGSKDLLQND